MMEKEPSMKQPECTCRLGQVETAIDYGQTNGKYTRRVSISRKVD